MRKPSIPDPEFINDIVNHLKSKSEIDRVRKYCTQFQTKVIEFDIFGTWIRLYHYDDTHRLFVFNSLKDVRFKEYNLTKQQADNIKNAFFNEKTIQ